MEFFELLEALKNTLLLEESVGAEKVFLVGFLLGLRQAFEIEKKLRFLFGLRLGIGHGSRFLREGERGEEKRKEDDKEALHMN